MASASDTHTDHKGADPKGPDAKGPARGQQPPVKKPAPDDEDAGDNAPVAKQKTLPTGLSRAIVIATFIFSIAYACVGLLSDRYAISPVPNSANSFVYRIDRLTGAIEFCGAQQCSTVRTGAAE
ncbi:MAG: hypothetical protein AB7H70_08870 [Rhodospirillaceae bacterium]